MSGGLKLGHYPFSHRASRASPVADVCAIERNGSRLQKSAHQNGRPLPAARRRNAALASGGSNESRQLGFRHPPVYNKPVQPKGLAEGKLIVTHLNQNIAAKLMESVLAAFRSETADLERLAEEGQDVGKIRTSIEQYAKRRTQAMETIHSMLQADAAEFREALPKR